MKLNFNIVTLNQTKITDFALARNLAMKAAAKDWVLFVDSDETISKELEEEINALTEAKVYCFKRQDWFMGRVLHHGETSQVRLPRLMPKNSGHWEGKVHERFITKLPLQILQHPLIHHRRISVRQFLKRLNNYSSIRADESKHFSIFELLFYPPLKFVKNYIWHLGFLDGLPGFAMAFFMSLHSLAVRVKQYENS